MDVTDTLPLHPAQRAFEVLHLAANRAGAELPVGTLGIARNRQRFGRFGFGERPIPFRIVSLVFQRLFLRFDRQGRDSTRGIVPYR